MKDNIIEKMKEINRMRDNGEITSEEATHMKYELMDMQMEDNINKIQRETDNISGCST